MLAAASVAETRSAIVASRRSVALLLLTCTAGASPKRLGSVYSRPTTRAIARIVYFHHG